MGTQTNGTIWQNKTFRKLFTAYSVSTFGDWFDIIAITVLLAYNWQSSPLAVAMIPVMFALPGILFGSFAGVLADRSKKINIMIIADLLVAVLTIGLMLAPNIFWVLPLLALRATLGVFNVPAQQALTRQVVAEDHLLKATTYNGMVNQTSKIVGPLLGSAALVFFSPQMCMLINAIARLFSALVLLTVRKLDVDQPQFKEGKEKPKFSEQWREGWAFLFRNKLVLNTFVFTVLGIMAIQLIDFQAAVLYRELMPDNPEVTGWIISCSGLGAVIGLTLMNRLQHIRYGLAFGGSYLLLGAGFGGAGLLKAGISVVWPLLLAILVGLGVGVFMVASQFVLQKETPKDMIGRIFGIQNTIASSVVIVAPLLGGTLIQLFGAGLIFMGVGLSVFGLGLLGLLLRKRLWPQPRTSTQAQPSTVSSGN